MQILRLIFFILISILWSNLLIGQITYYEDVFHGEVTVVGTSTADGSGTILFNTNLAPNSVVRKAFLVCAGNKGFNFTPNFREFKIDTQLFQVTENNPTELLVDNLTIIPPPADYNGHITFVKDLSNEIQTIGSQISLEWVYNPTFPPSLCPSCNISAPLLVLLIQDNSLPQVNFVLTLNNQKNATVINLTQTNLNAVNDFYPIAMSIHSDRLGGGPNDGYQFTINGSNAGFIKSADNNQYSIFSGAVGCYHYGNNILTGLTDDDPDPIFYGPSAISDTADGLATINNYLINNSINPFNLIVQYTGDAIGQHNTFISYTLAYSTPCQPQNVTVSNDTIICPNVPLPLHATGGTPNSHSMSGYEWLPQENLSCYDCADPVFTGDSSQLYTVRIWGSDSCSVVRPVMVRVRPKPTFSNLSLTPSECGGANGTVSVVSLSGVAYSFDSLSWQTSPNSAYTFENLAAGNYTVFVTDTNGCIGDSSVFIAEQLTVNAAFTATPTAGAIPLQVNLSNQSTNYTNLEWFIAGASQGNTLSNYTINQSGTLEITLVSWQNDPTCADTAQVSILAFDSLIISIPNIITPNNDGTNDVFSISSNLPIDVEYFITNRWGNTVASGLLTNQQGEITLWDGASTASLNNQNPTEGVYFYVLQLSSLQNNIQKQLEALGSEQHGMVTVVR